MSEFTSAEKRIRRKVKEGRAINPARRPSNLATREPGRNRQKMKLLIKGILIASARSNDKDTEFYRKLQDMRNEQKDLDMFAPLSSSNYNQLFMNALRDVAGELKIPGWRVTQIQTGCREYARKLRRAEGDA